MRQIHIDFCYNVYMFVNICLYVWVRKYVNLAVTGVFVQLS